jgi:hypothetical protein
MDAVWETEVARGNGVTLVARRVWDTLVPRET